MLQIIFDLIEIPPTVDIKKIAVIRKMHPLLFGLYSIFEIQMLPAVPNQHHILREGTVNRITENDDDLARARLGVVAIDVLDDVNMMVQVKSSRFPSGLARKGLCKQSLV